MVFLGFGCVNAGRGGVQNSVQQFNLFIPLNTLKEVSNLKFRWRASLPHHCPTDQALVARPPNSVKATVTYYRWSVACRRNGVPLRGSEGRCFHTCRDNSKIFWRKVPLTSNSTGVPEIMNVIGPEVYIAEDWNTVVFLRRGDNIQVNVDKKKVWSLRLRDDTHILKKSYQLSTIENYFPYPPVSFLPERW